MSNLIDAGAERAVLSGLFAYGLDSYVEISDIVSHETFGNYNNQVIYKCIEKVFQNDVKLDIPALLSASEQLGLYSVISSKQELEYLNLLRNFPVSKENVLNFAIQIKKFEFARNIKALGIKISNDVENIKGDESIDSIISILEEPVINFLREDSLSSKPEKIWNGVDEYIDFVIENKCDQIGIPTGYSHFDAAIGGGLRRKCVDLVSARPKVGKSAFGDNVALNIAARGIPVLMLDTEMSKEDHLNRIIASKTKIPINDISTGKFSEDEESLEKVKNSAQELKALKYTYASVAGAPFEHILNTIKRWILHEVGQDENGRTNDCVVVYDYLKLMSSSAISNNMQEYQVLGFQITALHNLAVKYDFPVLSFVQLNRDGITKESTDAVSGSDRLIWLCTSFSIFKEKSPEELAEDGPSAGNRKLVTVVARHGPAMEDGNYLNMKLEKDICYLKQLQTRNQLFAACRSSDGGFEGSDAPFDPDDDIYS
jgi:replicative DNA helicase